MGLFDDTIGAVFVSSTISAVLYGVTLMQSLTYFQSFPEDRKAIKYMVAALVMLDTIHMIFATHSIYVYVITNFANIEALIEIPWSISALIIATDIQDRGRKGSGFKKTPSPTEGLFKPRQLIYI
ncbi:hypothetical protein SCHPADRAFT_378521 [Schizopora paradoxa]|uniref:Uncharacterized protein n=1 Tax=Schizopora paradoxa TaxID=27342 RepID=A0A0H2RUK4_9AGAM|nr:hypothetical protein SCHPADRAFT_378521 [Schizopora paradoxa]